MEQQSKTLVDILNPEVSPLVAIVDKLQEQAKARYDVVVPAGYVKYEDSGILTIAGEEYAVSELAHEQIGEKLEIPRSYYRKMKSEYPSLLSGNINGWLSKKEKTKYLLRTFKYADTDNVCRALLSNRYNIIDNSDVLYAALEAIKDTGIHVEIVKAEITEKRMYLHVVAPEIHIEATKLLDGYLADRDNAMTGNGIISGMVISNSEVGLGTYEISARAQILKCKNGLHDRNAQFRKVHLGAALNDGIIDWSQNTISKNYGLIVAQTADAVKTYLSKDYLGQLTTRLQKAKDTPVEHGIQVIEHVSNTLGITDQKHRQNILQYFLRDQQDQTALGVLNAVTRESQNMDADTQYQVESDMFNLLPAIWKFDKPAGKN
jgi:hypothetical protein